MKYLIVGLGNVGDEYDRTRHNIGFRVLDAFAKASNIAFEDKRYGFVGRGRVKNAEVVLLKPSTFMNLSGNAVRYWMMPVGAIRMKQGGSSAGHNGLKHIASVLGTEGYNRLRFGIGNDFPRGMQVDFVLGRFSPEDEKLCDERALVAVEAIKAFCLSGMSFAMCHYNNK